MKRINRIMSFILAVLMVLTIFPFSAFAEKGDPVESETVVTEATSKEEQETDSADLSDEPPLPKQKEVSEPAVQENKTEEEPAPEVSVIPENTTVSENTTEPENTQSPEHIHATETLEHILSASPTCERDGNIEYWYCKDCDAYFVMQEDTLEETQKENVVQKATGHDYTEEGICEICDVVDINYIFNKEKTVDDVKVTVTAEAGVFPGGSSLYVDKVNLEEKKNQEIAEAVEEEREENKTVQSSYAFDIKVLDREGNEIQPNGEVKVSFALNEINKKMDPELSVDVYHVKEENNSLNAEIIDEKKIEIDKTAKELIIETDGFSYYVVEFTKTDETTGEVYQYVLQGDSKIALSEILKTLQIEEKEIENVTVSNPELFDAKLEDGIWYVYALQAFDTEETMTITFADGNNLTITVTDDNTQYCYLNSTATDQDVINLISTIGNQINGKYWNAYNPTTTDIKYNSSKMIQAAKTGNYTVGTTNAPCNCKDVAHHQWACDGYSMEGANFNLSDWNAGYRCTSCWCDNALQCNGFARYMAYALFGSSISSKEWSVKTQDITIDDLKPGDILSIGSHWVTIWYVVGNTIYVAESNYGNTCKIHFGKTGNDLISNAKSLYHHSRSSSASTPVTPSSLISMGDISTPTVTSDNIIIKYNVTNNGVTIKNGGFIYGEYDARVLSISKESELSNTAFGVYKDNVVSGYATASSLPCTYNLKTECGISLLAGTNYYIRPFVIDTNGNVYLHPVTKTVKTSGQRPGSDTTPPTIPESSVRIVNRTSTGYRVICKVLDPSGIQSVDFYTWSQSDQGDMKVDIGTPVGGSDNNEYYIDVNLSGYTNPNAIHTHIYPCDTFGNRAFGAGTAYSPDAQGPTITNIQIVNKSADGFRLAFTVTDNVEVASVDVLCKSYWTKESNDHRWVNATKGSNNTWYLDRLFSDFINKEHQEFSIRAFDTSGNSTIVATSNDHNTTPPSTSNIVAENFTKDGFNVLCNVQDDQAVSSVRIAVWCNSNQSDLIWRDATKQADGRWFVPVLFNEHPSTADKYIVHVYAYDDWQNLSLTDQYIRRENNKPEISNISLANISNSSFDVQCNVSDASEQQTTIAVYTKADKSDITTKEAKLKNGKYSATFNMSEFTEIPQNIHILVTSKDKWTNTSLLETEMQFGYRCIYHNCEGADNPNPSIRLGASTFTLKNPSKPGYVFGGWYTDEQLKTKITSISSSIKRDMDLYAKWTPVKYTIKYNLNGGTNSKNVPATYTYEETVTLSQPTKKGYSFAGWYTTSTFEDSSKIETIPQHSTTNYVLYAKWTLDTYNITWNLDGGTYPGTQQSTYTFVDNTIKLLNPTKAGYTFGGWYTDQVFKTKIASINKGSAGDLTLYAKWNEITYKITYNLNDGKNDPSNPVAYGISSGTVTLNLPTRIGYTFDGWYMDAKFTTPYTPVDYTYAKAFTVYAKWTANTYTVTYDANGATGNMDSQTVSYDQNLKLNPMTFSNPGYLFTGWEMNGSTKLLADKASVKNLATENGATVTLKAIWKVASYKVAFNLNGGKGTLPNGNEWKEFKGIDKTFNIPSISITPPAGYLFTGWNTKNDGTGRHLNENEQNVVLDCAKDKSTITLYAEYQCTVNLYNDDGSTLIQKKDLYYNENFKPTADPDTYKLGNTLTGWSTNNTNKVSLKAGAAVKNPKAVNGEYNLYAVWTPAKYTIKYNLNGGINPKGAATTYTYEEAVTLPQPTKKGYSFAGWYTTSTFEDGTNLSEIPQHTSKNYVLYAKWNLDTYTITWNLDGGTYLGTKPDTYTFTTNTIKLLNPTKVGYTFGGWYTDQGTWKKKVTSINKGSAGDITLYAKWNEITYKITYNLNGGKNDPSNPTVYGISYPGIVTLNDPTRTGYTFSGWYLDAKFTKPYTPVDYTYAKAFTVYAKWTANPYTVAFDANTGTGSMNSQTAVYDQNLKLNPVTFEKAGYTFTGWNTKPDGKGLKFADKASVKNLAGNGTVTLYAQWSIVTYTVKFNMNGGTAPDKTTFADQKNLCIGINELNIPDAVPTFTDKATGMNYTFGGWNTKADGTGDAYTTTDTYIRNAKNKSTVTLYAVWNYTVSFDSNGGEGNMNDQTMTYTKSEKLNGNVYTRDGYTFVGWNTNKTNADKGTVQYKDLAAVKNIGLNKTLYAVWKPNTYTIVYNANGGTGRMSNTTATYGKYVCLRNNSFKRVGYEFDGWDTQQDGKGTRYYDGDEVENLTTQNTVTLYAQWIKVETVEINTNNVHDYFDFSLITTGGKEYIVIKSKLYDNGFVVTDSTANLLFKNDNLFDYRFEGLLYGKFEIDSESKQYVQTALSNVVASGSLSYVKKAELEDYSIEDGKREISFKAGWMYIDEGDQITPEYPY